MNGIYKSFLDTKRLRSALLTAFWLMLITFPIMVMKVNAVESIIIWRWENLVFIAVAGFIGTYLWQYLLDRQQRKSGVSGKLKMRFTEFRTNTFAKKGIRYPALAVIALLVVTYPLFSSLYNTSIMTTALIYVVLGLGLNIIIGLGGLLHLGYAAFFAVGAYTYAMLYKYFGLTFWPALPLGAIVAVVFGLLIGFPVLRLRGDYLAIVTLGFGEIVRIVLNNMGELTGGPDGISRIPRPDLFGMKLSLGPAMTVTYYVAVFLVLLTIFVVRRLEDSRIGRALEAMREDEVAAESMGIDIAKTKLITFAIGSAWAGFAGVLMAAKTTKVTPDSFGLMESVIVLCIVVLGGMGSIPGVLLGALVFKIVMEYFRVFAAYRMLIFGAVLVIMMVFRPGGFITKVRKSYRFGSSGENL